MGQDSLCGYKTGEDELETLKADETSADRSTAGEGQQAGHYLGATATGAAAQGWLESALY